MSKNNKLETVTLNRIEQALTNKKRKSPVQKTPEKKVIPKKSPSRSPLSKSPIKPSNTPVYHPMQKDYALVQRQVRTISNEIEQNLHWKVQNKHSYFLNSKNPRPPLYQRAQQIAKQKQFWLQERRKEKKQQMDEKQALEEEQQIINHTPSRKMTKNQALELSERLYKEHYDKLSRNNASKIRRITEQSQNYRNKPEISEVSKEIFKLCTQKKQLEDNVFDRFNQYKEQSKRKNKQHEKMVKSKYYPFQPTFNDNSRMLIKSKSSKGQLTRNDHCISCIEIKRDKSRSQLNKSQYKKSYDQSRNEDYGVISRFQ